MYEIGTYECEPKNFFAGEFPTVPETGTAAADIDEYTPVTESSGTISAVTADTVASVIGITAAAAKSGEPVVYYMTGEFFLSAINIPSGVDEVLLKAALRKVSIFLKGEAEPLA
jgi:hypothetical protein